MAAPRVAHRRRARPALGPLPALLLLLWSQPAPAQLVEVDLDEDGIEDTWETGCGLSGGARTNPTSKDSDGDRLHDFLEVHPDGFAGSGAPSAGAVDSDDDGTIDGCDDDSDDDGITDVLESGCAALCEEGVDSDGDGTPDFRDDDSDGDGALDEVEGSADADGDGVPNWRDNDDEDGPLGDADGDGQENASDNCPAISNPDQADQDLNGLGDACDDDDDGDGVLDGEDNCLRVANASQVDLDDDGRGDACDSDDDGDGVPDVSDNCVRVANPQQQDADEDGFGDACDEGDGDGDGIPDGADNCPALQNADQADQDGDGQGDACDNDDDGDGVGDVDDNCALVANGGQADADGDGQGDVCDPDDDDDGVLDSDDNCPSADNPGQEDVDGDGQGDACEDDSDADGVPDLQDNCVAMANAGQANLDGDALGDACDDDDDGDGVDDVADNCPAVANADQANTGGGPAGDACEDANDDDNDGVRNDEDNCPAAMNSDQTDSDSDGIGDVCDEDDDGDGVHDLLDNCPTVANFDQRNSDGFGAGDACDPDDDGDGVPDDDDNCPRRANASQDDLDVDGLGDVCDGDDDGDGVGDESDVCPRAADPAQEDADEDGLGDACAPPDPGDGGEEDPEKDTDGDGAPDAFERSVGTDPDDAADVPLTRGSGLTFGCASAGSGDVLVFALALAGLLFSRSRPRRRRSRSGRRGANLVVVALLALSSPRLADAQEGFNARTFNPGAVGRGGAVVEDSNTLAPFDAQADLLVDYAHAPVVLRSPVRGHLTGVVDGAVFGEVRAALGLPWQLELDASLPLAILEVASGPAAVDGSALGDARVGLKWSPLMRSTCRVGLPLLEAAPSRLGWGGGRCPFGASLDVEVNLPTGSPVHLTGDGGPGARVSGLVDHKLGPVVLAGTLGARFGHEIRALQGVAVGPQMTWGALASWRFGPEEMFHVSTEAVGALALDLSPGASPMELLSSAGAWIGPVHLLVGGGAGLGDAVGVPAWRMFAGAAFRWQWQRDADDDGLGDDVDACVDRAEDKDGHQDADGCPDEDDDGDGLPDVADGCPRNAEDLDGFEDADGCPEADNDGDTILDANDACPNQAEDVDGFEDEDGCPEADNDGDGVVDARDACPLLAETHNGFSDDDGCADEVPTYLFRQGERLVFHDIHFRLDSYEIKAESHPLLDEIVRSLKEQPTARVRVEGHTDSQGAAKRNLVLSQQRALAVVNYLVSKGIDSRRLEHAGYGDTRPVASNKTKEGRAKNRRVELLTLDAPAMPAPPAAAESEPASSSEEESR